MSPKKKQSISDKLDRTWRLWVIYMAKDMTLKNPWALFLGSTMAGILTWTLIPSSIDYAFFKVPVISEVLQNSLNNPRIVSEITSLIFCMYLTYVLLKPFCRGLVVCHPNYFNEGSLR